MRKNQGTLGAGAAALVAATGLAISQSHAQECASVVAGSVAMSAAHVTRLHPQAAGAKGDNLIGIPAFSSINEPRTGFMQLCALFGLDGTASTISQINGQNGNVVTYVCDQPVAPDFQPCQGALIKLANGLGPVERVLPMGIDSEGLELKVDGSWQYPTFGLATSRSINGNLGDHLFGIPLTMQDVDGDSNLTGEDVCRGLNLVAESEVMKIDAGGGQVFTHVCGQMPTFHLDGGEGVRIRSGPGCAPGSLCATGSVPS